MIKLTNKKTNKQHKTKQKQTNKKQTNKPSIQKDTTSKIKINLLKFDEILGQVLKIEFWVPFDFKISDRNFLEVFSNNPNN